MDTAYRPGRADLLAAVDRRVPDVIDFDLPVLFCGINPGLYSAAVGHHFARPGNRFWPAIHQAGFTPRLLAASEDGDLLRFGCGITNVVDRATAVAGELARQELIVGGKALREKVLGYHPRWLAVLGVTAYRTAFAWPAAALGRQVDTLGATAIWVLPNPSGLNAHFSLTDLIRLFAEFRSAALPS